MCAYCYSLGMPLSEQSYYFTDYSYSLFLDECVVGCGSSDGAFVSCVSYSRLNPGLSIIFCPVDRILLLLPLFIDE